MSDGRRTTAALALIAALALSACERESRRFREVPPTIASTGAVSMDPIQPGARTPEVTIESPYMHNAYEISQGKQLYNQWNCVGCHSHGGGGMGPPLMDDQWIYGSDPENIVQTILEGRPNGMPSFRGRMANTEAWAIAAYVRSMSGLTPQGARSSRDDAMMPSSNEALRSAQKPKLSSFPPAAERP
jgi:cytochrome c oxidase cbb3-type subunit 3